MIKLAIFRAAVSRAKPQPAPSPRRERQLVCIWTRDPASGLLVCRWRRADTEQAQTDRPRRLRDRGRPPSVALAAA